MGDAADLRSLGFPTREMYNFPNIVNVEVCRGACPCSCVHCPVGTTRKDERGVKFREDSMKLPLFKRIIEEMSLYPWSTLRIHAVGEPLLWKMLPDALRIARENGVRCWLFTSAVTSDKRLLDVICENARIVEVSVNSTDREDYLRTKGVDAFDLVMQNMHYMHRIKSRFGFRLIVSRVQSQDKAADEGFVKHWKSTGLVDDAFIRAYHTYNDLLPSHSARPCSKRRKPCLVHWARFNISVDGRAVVCFNELFNKSIDPSVVLGDVRTHSISSIWQGEKLRDIRKAELSGDYSCLHSSGALPCKDCTSCQPLRGNRKTSEAQITLREEGRSA
jgi:MoaA/NifB/PqqE/SkfB family radical SAM enzyme